MKNTKRKWDLIPKEKKAKLIQETITYFKTKRDQEIGIVAAEEILDFFLDVLGPTIYNRAIHDSKDIVKQSAENLEIDLELLVDQSD